MGWGLFNPCSPCCTSCCDKGCLYCNGAFYCQYSISFSAPSFAHFLDGPCNCRNLETVLAGKSMQIVDACTWSYTEQVSGVQYTANLVIQPGSGSGILTLSSDNCAQSQATFAGCFDCSSMTLYNFTMATGNCGGDRLNPASLSVISAAGAHRCSNKPVNCANENLEFMVYICNSNGVPDDNYNIYLNNNFLGFLDLNAWVVCTGAKWKTDSTIPDCRSILHTDGCCQAGIKDQGLIPRSYFNIPGSNILEMRFVSSNSLGNFGTVSVEGFGSISGTTPRYHRCVTYLYDNYVGLATGDRVFSWIM